MLKDPTRDFDCFSDFDPATKVVVSIATHSKCDCLGFHFFLLDANELTDRDRKQ